MSILQPRHRYPQEMHSLSSFLMYSSCAIIFLLIFSGCALHKEDLRRIKAEGDKNSALLSTRYSEIRDPQLVGYLNSVKGRLLAGYFNASSQDLKIDLVLLATNDEIALTPALGRIFISKGIVRKIGTEGELAFIIAHEIAHTALNHPLLLEESRHDLELEADRFGVSLMASAGYDPNMARAAIINTYHSTSSSDFRYPTMESRVRSIDEFITESGWEPPGTVTRRDFKKFRDLLSAS